MRRNLKWVNRLITVVLLAYSTSSYGWIFGTPQVVIEFWPNPAADAMSAAVFQDLIAFKAASALSGNSLLNDVIARLGENDNPKGISNLIVQAIETSQVVLINKVDLSRKFIELCVLARMQFAQNIESPPPSATQNSEAFVAWLRTEFDRTLYKKVRKLIRYRFSQSEGLSKVRISKDKLANLVQQYIPLNRTPFMDVFDDDLNLN